MSVRAKGVARKSVPPKPTQSSSDLETLRQIALSFAGVEEGTSYGTLAYRVRKKFLCRMKEDGESLAIRMDFAEREMLIEGEPETFYITDHYRNYEMVLIHLSKIHPEELKRIFANAWRKYAGKRLLKSTE